MKRIVFEDVDFCFGVQKVRGQIVAEQGIPVFYAPAEHLITRVPFPISSEYYGQELDAYVHVGGKELLTELGEDDILVSKLTDDDLDLLEELETLEAMAEEEKIREAPILAKYFLTMFVSILALAATFLAYRLLPWSLPTTAYLGVGLVLTLIFIFGLARFASRIRFMSTTRVYDRSGRWVDLQTGETSLNGGSMLPRKEDTTAI